MDILFRAPSIFFIFLALVSCGGGGNSTSSDNGDEVLLAANFTDSGQLLGDYITRSIALGDIDDDGDLDMVVGNGFDLADIGQENRVYLNNGTGSFTDSGQLLGAKDSLSIVLGDLDGDGDLDIATANRARDSFGISGGSSIYFNNGIGSFSDSGQLLGTSENISIALGDVDGDGDLDMVVANRFHDSQIYVNDGTGGFSDSGQSLGTSGSIFIALGDVDGDSDLDIVQANVDGLGGGNQVVYINNGAGSFSDSGQLLGTSEGISIALGDIDGDGDLDMVVANRSSDGVYINDGTGSFSDSGQSLSTTDSNAIALGDVDSDGDLDIVVAKGTSGGWVYSNDGAGHFADSGLSLGEHLGGSLRESTNFVTLGDVNTDGRLDIVFGLYGQPCCGSPGAPIQGESNRVFLSQ